MPPALANIRNLTLTDRSQWEHLWAAYLAFYQAHLAHDVTAKVFSRLAGDTENLFALVAEHDAKLVGLVHCVTHPATWSLGDHCYLEDLYVSAAARGHGLGRALNEAVRAEPNRRGCTRTYRLTDETNITARALYDKLARASGFIQYRRT